MKTTTKTTRKSSKKRSDHSTGKKTSRSRSSKSTPAKSISNFSSALKWLNSRTDYERLRVLRYNNDTFGLNRIRKLLKAFGSPHKNLKCVHIAGTKGKGSTCAMLDSMLRACDYTVGLFTSPHLMDVRERIQINGESISAQDFTDLMTRMQVEVDKLDQDDQPTFFEVLTIAAILYFTEQAVDIAVIETGLGGRLDATNVLSPEVCAITEISFDHTDVLGKTLPLIAKEKAGIFKKATPALSIGQSPEVNTILQDVAEEADTRIELLGEDLEFSYRFETNRELGQHFRVCLSTPTSRYEHLAVPLQGEHQAANCGLALAVIDKLQQRGFDLPENKIVEGLANTRLEGRMEIVWQEPRILLDGAHNAASIKAMIRSIGAHVPYDSLVMVFGCLANKDILGMLREVNLGADKVIFTKVKNHPRSMDPDELNHTFREFSDKMSQVADNLSDALELAARAVSREDIICVCGSFYMVGEAKRFLTDLAARRAKRAAEV